ncbi:MAG: V-type ATP synthase subunit K, partial [Thermoplasmata archaeon]|nr:V-type ATP synthase subunit K [Thermoplasmata archaeon]
AIGQGIAAGSGAAASSEEPRAFSKSIIFSVLPETQSIYALIVSIIILYSAGLLGGAPHFSSTMALLVGIGAIGAGLSIGFAGLSGIGQGITAAMGIGAFTRRPESFGKSMMLSVMSETFAIFGLLIAILILRAIGVF